jgi:stearoyl-CoA desaturase (Delta-9 desaturase)
VTGTLVILTFFVLHWQLSVFSQSFFLHRFGAHRQFAMSKGWERFFHLFTFLTQGSSYLNPRGYAILHRMHHAYSDTAKDPHSPENHSNVFSMMWTTALIYAGFVKNKTKPEPRFDGGTPEWPALEKVGDFWGTRLAFGVAYTLVYIAFAPHWAFYLLLPAHYVMGPIHGAIVNWCGHRYGYRNFESNDVSRNTLVFDVLTAGELFQNNHHKFGMSPNFAVRWFEIDPTYQVMKVLSAVGVIDMAGAQTMKWKPSDRDGVAVEAASETPSAEPLPGE